MTTEKLTWRKIKAHPIRAIREIREIEDYAAESRSYARECEGKFDQVRDQLHNQADLFNQITRLQSQVYDLKKRLGLPR